MTRDRKCILCETVYVSKQEMDEHTRSMLHHRELENLKGRDCGHECRVCKVKVVSLTDYASHISSPMHKQNVEAADQKPPGLDHEEDYFDQELVDLIEKRKEKIRKEKEAAAAKLAKDEEDKRRKEAFQQRLKEAKERYSLQRGWQQPGQGFGGSREIQPWNQRKQGKSATWHAQEPPNLERWASGEFAGRSSDSQEARSNKTWGHCAFPGKNENRFPWLSNGGSRNGLYGQNNISQYTQKNRSKSSKTLGSNPKIDKSCRWSPYPVKGLESVPHKDTGPKSSEEYPRAPKPQNKAPEATGFNSQSQSEKESSLLPLSRLEEKGRHKTNPAVKPRDGSSSRSSSSQRDGHQNSASNWYNQNANKSLLDRKMSSAPGISSVAHLSKIPSQAQVQSKPTGIQSEVKASLTGSFQSRQQKLPESVKHAKQIVLEKKGSLNTFGNNIKVEMTQHSVEEPQTNQVQSQTGVNKEISCRQNAVKSVLPDPVGSEKLALTSSDSSQFLQSLQVSTSTVETSKLAESGREYEENNKKVEKQSCSVVADEAMQVSEAGQSSESDTSRSGDAQTHASSLSKLDLPPVLKRDLTKHISSKSKTVGHEPNLNIARRVRNVNESRRSDTEKDSGLKPTVRQLISSSGSRRNVNWEQVYHEVRKKQDKGKGMPRFGIEMVSYEQEYQSQEEGDIPLLEGFQWESLMDVSYQGPSRKRSLSESSLAPQGSTVNPNRKSSLGNQDCQSQPEVGQMLVHLEAKAQNQTALQRSDSVLGDSSSGTEQCDGLGTAKRRRAAGVSLGNEHNSKRQKVKSKRERSHIDQLLAVSLREDELSRSLQTVDTSLIQARAALEAAYMEVQRLMVVKQQVCTQLNSIIQKLSLRTVTAQSGRVSSLPRSISAGTQTAFPDDIALVGHDGIYDRRSAAWAVENESVSTLDSLSPFVCFASPPEEAAGNCVLHASSPSLEGARATAPGLSDWEGVVSQGGVHRCFPKWVGSAVRGCVSERDLVRGSAPAAHQPLRAVSSVLSSKAFPSSPAGQHVLVRTDNSTVVSYINRQGGTRSLPLLQLSRSLLLWCSVHFLTLRATHVPGHLNLGRTFSPGGSSGERMEVTPFNSGSDLGSIWRGANRSFASRVNAHCPCTSP
uniref:Zinc finger protein 106 n=1 Tax=Maylandia zebra TaxID=106582 RepID=A0A3P9C179_9CICH